MAVVSRSAKAEGDLQAILQELEQANPSVADRYANEFSKKSHALAKFPELGRRRPEIAPGLHSTLVHPYIMFYRIQGDEVQILRILHERQDHRRILRDEPHE